MGDKHHLNLDCKWCGKMNDEPDELGFPPIYYAESGGVATFKCYHCGKENKIYMYFKSEKLIK